jgi:hypothetical protein
LRHDAGSQSGRSEDSSFDLMSRSARTRYHDGRRFGFAAGATSPTADASPGFSSFYRLVAFADQSFISSQAYLDGATKNSCAGEHMRRIDVAYA